MTGRREVQRLSRSAPQPRRRAAVAVEHDPSIVRAIVATALFVGLVASGARTTLLRFVVPPFDPPAAAGPTGGVDRKPLRLKQDPTPQELAIFLQMVRLQTRDGDRIAIILPPPHDGFSYAYWRASYDLAGRTVLLPPEMIDVGSASYACAWRDGWSDPRFELVWSGYGGTLFRRR